VFQNLDSLDPAATGLITSGQILANVLDPLMWRLPDASGTYRLYPGLAQSVQVSADAKTYTFKLRKGIKFHDGTPFDAHAVKASFDHIVNPATKAKSALRLDLMPQPRRPCASAEQPEPGSRLLQGVVTSWKYTHRVRCRRFPPVVARLRSCPDAPASSACASTG
jgi:ABC-type transport system substrate-binding protein